MLLPNPRLSSNTLNVICETILRIKLFYNRKNIILTFILPLENGSVDDDGSEIDIEIPPGNAFFFFSFQYEYRI